MGTHVLFGVHGGDMAVYVSCMVFGGVAWTYAQISRHA
jgi:hypothetical protein